ncbi:hypothetical protein [Spirillospora sp. NBC_01491]|uniref:hypothetical protein n=1 Tax=Spirillospora sp. NBC_01491 TaxID=2976007 RepID=UPI002E37CF12|nr:hypothetical protein [Spirillospora sp. NBC_01491]
MKKARAEHLYAIADGEVIPEPGEPTVVICLDEFGPLNLMPHLTTERCRRVTDWAEANNAEVAYTPTTVRGSTTLRPSSPRCAASLWTAPTNAATKSKAA